MEKTEDVIKKRKTTLKNFFFGWMTHNYGNSVDLDGNCQEGWSKCLKCKYLDILWG